MNFMSKKKEKKKREIMFLCGWKKRNKNKSIELNRNQLLDENSTDKNIDADNPIASSSNANNKSTLIVKLFIHKIFQFEH